MARPRSKLSEKQEAFVDAVMEGKNPSRAAGIAYGRPTAGSNLMQSSTVKAEIAKAREELSNLTTLKRLDVLEGIMDGINIARVQADAGNVIKGWTEIAKILGHYAPEVKQVNLTFNQQRTLSKLEGMSTEELLAIAEGNVVIEGELGDGQDPQD